jgi:hypothetical protein
MHYFRLARHLFQKMAVRTMRERLIAPTDTTISLRCQFASEPVDPRARKTICPPGVFLSRPLAELREKSETHSAAGP